MWGHMGVEWDLTDGLRGRPRRAGGAGSPSTRRCATCSTRGDVVHADLANPALLLEGVVAPDQSDALYRLAAVDHTLTWPPGRVTLPGLDPDRDVPGHRTGPR